MIRMTLIAKIKRTAKTIPPLINSWKPISRLHTFINNIIDYVGNKHIEISVNFKSAWFSVMSSF